MWFKGWIFPLWGGVDWRKQTTRREEQSGDERPEVSARALSLRSRPGQRTCHNAFHTRGSLSVWICTISISPTSALEYCWLESVKRLCRTFLLPACRNNHLFGILNLFILEPRFDRRVGNTSLLERLKPQGLCLVPIVVDGDPLMLLHQHLWLEKIS